MPTALKSTTVEVANGNTRSVHNNGVMGFLKSDGNWDMYVNNNGQVWTANYGWLHDCFFSTISNCSPQTTVTGQNIANCVENCTYFGDNAGVVFSTQLVDEGSNIRVRSVRHYCNCNCACTCK